MVKHDKIGITDVIKNTDKRHNNVFHLCAMFSKHEVFTQVAGLIGSNDNVSQIVTLRALLKPNMTDGKLPFHLFREEEGEFVIVNTLSRLQDKESELGIDLNKEFVQVKTKKGNSSLTILIHSFPITS